MEHVRAVTVLESASSPISHKTTSSHTVLSNGKTYNLRDKNTINLNLNNVKDNNNNQTVSGQKVSSSTNSYDNVENKATDFLYEYFGLKFKSPIKWTNTIAIVIVHAIFLYAFLTYPLKSTLLTTMWGFFVGGVGGFGVTGGAHRMWCHRAYKANVPLRIILMLSYCVAGQNTLYDWVRDHRVHHKYSETDADPHNSNRGFFFAHVGWLMLHKHPEVLSKGRAIDMSDVLNDPVVQFHQKFFIPIKIIMCFVIPTIVPVLLWNETWYMAFMSQSILRYIFGLNFTWLVNSAAHMWGLRSYDKKINPVENKTVALLAMGEGWHNYHHVFPWDYKAAELGNYSLNVTTFWLDAFAKIGWAYDLKQPSKDLIRKTIEKHGDGSHAVYGHANHCHPEEVPSPYEDDKKFY